MSWRRTTNKNEHGRAHFARSFFDGLEVIAIATSAKAVKKWQSTHVKRYGFPVMIDTEPEVIDKLESVQNKSAYIKNLIKADIAKGNA